MKYSVLSFYCIILLVTLLSLPFHVARHTFASTTTLAKGVSIEAVSKMLGHTNIKTTQIYARVTENMISNEMHKLTSQNK